jgi:hypothetical protein
METMRDFSVLMMAILSRIYLTPVRLRCEIKNRLLPQKFGMLR